MVRPVSFKGFQGVSLRGFRGFQIFLWMNRSLFDKGFIFSGFTFLARVGEHANYSDEKPQITPSILRNITKMKNRFRCACLI